MRLHTVHFSIHNTLYLEVHCPTIKPELVVISDNGRTLTDFGNVSIGQSIIKSITLQNISNKNVEVSFAENNFLPSLVLLLMCIISQYNFRKTFL